MFYLILYTLCFCIYHKVFDFVDKNSRYFIAHVIHNIMVMIHTYPIIADLVSSPIRENMYVYVPEHICAVLASLHIYHMIYYGLSYDELLHHVLAIYFHFFELNICLYAGLFFMTGLPGGITYLLLVLVRYDYIESITEKRISTYLNLWIRMPFILLFASIILLNMYNKSNYMDFLTIGYMYWNAIHFTETIITSYHKLLLVKN